MQILMIDAGDTKRQKFRWIMAGFFLAFLVALSLPIGRDGAAFGQDLTAEDVANLDRFLSRNAHTPDLEASAVVQLANSIAEEGNSIKAIQLLDHYSRRLASRFGQQYEHVLWLNATRADLLYKSGSTVEGLALYEDTLSQQLAVLGPTHISTVLSLVNVSQIYEDQGQIEASINLRRILVENVHITHPGSPSWALHFLSRYQKSLLMAGRKEEASGVSRDIEDRIDNILKSSSPLPAADLNAIAQSLLSLGDRRNELLALKLLESAYQQALTQEAPTSGLLFLIRRNLARSYLNLGRSRPALALFTENVNLARQQFGDVSLQMLEALGEYNNVLIKTRRYEELLISTTEHHAIAVELLGPEHPYTVDIEAGVIPVLTRMKRHDDAVALAKRVYDSTSKLFGFDSPDSMSAYLMYLMTLSAADQMPSSETLIAAEQRMASRLGSGHPIVRQSRIFRALTSTKRGDTQHAIATFERILTETPPGAESARVHDQIGVAAIMGRDHARALEAARAALSIKASLLAQNADTDIVAARAALDYGQTLSIHQSAAIGITTSEPDRRNALLSEAFESAQQVFLDRTGEAVRQAAIRNGIKDPETARDIKLQDLLMEEFRAVEAEVTRMVSDRGQLPSITRPAERLVELDTQIAALSERISRTNPDIAETFSSRPVSVGELQGAAGLLGPDDALILLNDIQQDEDDTSIVWVVTQTDIDAGFIDNVATFRAGLSAFRNQLDSELDGASAMQSEMAPFDMAGAHQVFRHIFGSPNIADMLNQKTNWIIIPTRKYLSVPYAALVTEPPKTEFATRPDHLRDASWLGQVKNLSILPSVSSLRGLKMDRVDSAERLAYVGFGDPAFQGVPAPLRTAAQSQVMNTDNITDAVRSLPRLSATFREVNSIASAFDPANTRVFTGGEANEMRLAHLANAGQLSQAVVLHFATHGLLAGGIPHLEEPALALSPPAKAAVLSNGFTDDGLLKGSEIARLSLNADWVILSACNTAGSGEIDAGGLTGLARAFFFAGAQSILATHWAVRDDVAARVIRETVFAAQETDNRAAALRVAVEDLMNDTSADATAYPFAHPALWAPFHIIGNPNGG